MSPRILKLLTSILVTIPFLFVILPACGKRKNLHKGDELDPNLLGGKGATRTSGKADSLGSIEEITMIIESQSGIADWSSGDLPFTGSPASIGQEVVDGQTPFSFVFDYPENNFQLSNAHLVIDTKRDSSDTEAIFVDGVFSGRPPNGMVNMSSSKIETFAYLGTGGTAENTYFIDWSLAHYKQVTRNTFDLNMDDLLTPSDKSTYDAIKDGFVPVVSGDDSPVYQGYLVIRGLTIADDKLSCKDSDTYTFQNVFLHNDGNSVGQSAFSGTVATPFTSWSAAVGAYDSAEFYYDAALPRVKTENISVSSASLSLSVKRAASGAAAIVINGIGVAEAAFNKNSASAIVESWSTSGQSAWSTFLATVPANGTQANVTLDLVSLLGATKVRDLLAQGKFNIAFAGSISSVRATAATSSRGFSAPVTGPELTLSGTYYTEVCDVQDKPNSPLRQDGLEQRDYDDGEGPQIYSVQVTDITASSATIIWLTDEPSTSQVKYGIKNTDLSTNKDKTYSVFHKVVLSGLSPYKYYYFQVESEDNFANASSTDVDVFVTLR